MITLSIDEKACVGCSLCADACPTGVFTFDAATDLPRVSEPRECFGCLSCSEICPATAISHGELPLSESFYHDPYALRLACRVTGAGGPRVNVPEDRAGGLADLGVRLRSVAWVLKDIMGNGLPVVGTIAGRTLANQLPRYQPPRNLSEALELARREFAPAWELSPRAEADSLSVEIGGCVLRDLCAREKVELGGELCVLFFNYLGGYLSHMGKTRLKPVGATRGAERCAYQWKRAD